ncbi:MAG: branched-chain amino acid ABC transporter permease [Chloroflexota bacterium]
MSLGVLVLVIGLVLLFGSAISEWYQLNSMVLRQSLVSGLLIGGVYGLVAMGLTLIFGVLGIINFAHGALMAMGMYVTYFAFAILGLDPYASIVLSVPALFLVGAAIQYLIVSRTMDALAHNQLLLTLGIAIFLENAYLVFFTADPRAVQVPYSGARLYLAETMISMPRVFAFMAGLALAGLLYLLLKHTRLGKAIRAAAEEREGSALVGINVSRINTITFGLGTAVAGAAGSLIMPFFTVTPTTGDTFNITAFVIVVLGGMGNVPGALVGGLIIGVTEALGALFLPGSSKQLGVFIVFILTLLFRPSGLFGGKRNA